MGSWDRELISCEHCCRSIELVEVFVQIKCSIFSVVCWKFPTPYRPGGVAMADGFLKGIKCGEIAKTRSYAVNVSWALVTKNPFEAVVCFPRCQSIFLLPFIDVSLLLRSSCPEKVFWRWKQWLGKIGARSATFDFLCLPCFLQTRFCCSRSTLCSFSNSNQARFLFIVPSVERVGAEKAKEKLGGL